MIETIIAFLAFFGKLIKVLADLKEGERRFSIDIQVLTDLKKRHFQKKSCRREGHNLGNLVHLAKPRFRQISSRGTGPRATGQRNTPRTVARGPVPRRVNVLPFTGARGPVPRHAVWSRIFRISRIRSRISKMSKIFRIRGMVADRFLRG